MTPHTLGGARLRAALAGLPDASATLAPGQRGDFDLNPGAHRVRNMLVPAAVLIPLIEHASGTTVLLTQRTDHLNDHAGQISFPGGRVEPDDEGPVATALRETEEEIGLDRNRVEIMGGLDVYETGTGFSVTPVVGLVAPGFTLRLDALEVAEAFEVPLDFLLHPANHRRHSRVFDGVERHFYAMPYGTRFIWGATAGMLVNLYDRLVP